MHISTLLGSIEPTEGLQYQGDPHATFNGLVMHLTKSGMRNMFFVLLDDSWGTRRARAYGKGKSAEEQVEFALMNGASGVIANSSLRGREVLKGANVIYVHDTMKFCYDVAQTLTRHHRAGKLIAVTGSAGKSTTTAMIGHCLRSGNPYGKVWVSPGNRNSAAPVLRNLSRVHRFDCLVLETAGSAFPYFSERGFTVSPDVAIVTSISEAHLDRHKSIDGVARDKSGLFRNMPPNGTAVINADTASAGLLLARARAEGARTVTYGAEPSADLRLLNYDAKTGEVHVSVEGREILFQVGARGRHMALNSLAVLAGLREAGVADWATRIKYLESFNALPGRGRVTPVTLSSGEKVTFIDDAYNANPASVRAALGLLAEWEKGREGRSIAVLGDILELGASADDIHRDLKDDVLASGLDEIHFVGNHMKHLHSAVESEGVCGQHWFDLTALEEYLSSRLRSADTVLFKGSHGSKVYTVVESLLKKPSMVNETP